MNFQNLWSFKSSQIIWVLLVFAKASITINHIYGLGFEQTLAHNSSQPPSDKLMKKKSLFDVLFMFLFIKHSFIYILIDFCFVTIIILLIAYVLDYYVQVMPVKLIWIWKSR